MNNESHIKLISEGATEVFTFIKKKTKKGPAAKGNYSFYNPSMELNRDLSVALNQWFIDNCKNSVNILDGLAASGIRGIRFANELEGNFSLYINDWSENAYNLIIKNTRGIDVLIFPKIWNHKLSEITPVTSEKALEELKRIYLNEKKVMDLPAPNEDIVLNNYKQIIENTRCFIFYAGNNEEEVREKLLQFLNNLKRKPTINS